MLTWSCELQRLAVNSLWIEKGLCWNSLLCLKLVETRDWKDPLVHWINSLHMQDRNSWHTDILPMFLRKKKICWDVSGQNALTQGNPLGCLHFDPVCHLVNFYIKFSMSVAEWLKKLKLHVEERWFIMYFFFLQWKEMLFCSCFCSGFLWRVVSLV